MLFHHWRSQAIAALDQKTKPPGSLGRLEQIAAQLAGIRQTLTPSVDRPAILIFAADHGIASLGVSAYPQNVTAQMMANFASGGAAINVLTRQNNIALDIIDAGVGIPTAPFTDSPAMSTAECQTALQLGRDSAKKQIRLSADLVGIGEMGIGNTTSAAALTAALLDIDPAEVTGRGTGIDDETLARKTYLIRQAIAHHRPAARSPLGWLAAVGGKEIAAMVGAIQGCAHANIPTVIDGFIATAAAAIAVKVNPAIHQNLLYAHRSKEKGHNILLAHRDAHPILDLEMRLGEATGAALAIPIIQSAAKILTEMATFTSAGVDSSPGA